VLAVITKSVRRFTAGRGLTPFKEAWPQSLKSVVVVAGAAVLLMTSATIASAQDTSQAPVANDDGSSGATQPAASPTASDIRTAFRIKYVAQGAVYLDGGRNAGLAEGVKLTIKEAAVNTGTSAAKTGVGAASAAQKTTSETSEPKIVAELQVVSVAESSAVCDIHSSSRELKTGDIAVLSSADAETLVQQRALSSTRVYPQVISFNDGDPLDEEAREEVPHPPLPEINRARGRIGFDYGGINSRGGANLQSSQFGLVLRTDITRIGGSYWNLTGYWRGRLDSRGSTGQPTLQDTINRTYHLGLTYDNPQSHWVAGAGRLYLPWATSLDTIDGGYFGRRFGKTVTAGIFGGSTPDPTSWSYNPDRRLAGTFINFEGGSFDALRYTSTSGFGISTLKWKIDRPFVFFENTVSYKRYVSIYHSLQVDKPTGNPDVPNPGTGISRSFFTVRLQPTDRIAFDFNHNYFRDIPTFDLNLLGTGLLDKALFQGVSAGVRVEPIKKIFLYTDLGRSNRSGDSKSSLNQLYGITFADIPHTGLRADVHYSKFDSPFAQGSYKAVSLSRTFAENLRLELMAGKQAFTSTFTRDNGSKFLNLSLDADIGSHYFAQGGYTLNRGGLQNYDQWFIALGYRFDNRLKQK
jgi:hypothetical protein